MYNQPHTCIVCTTHSQSCLPIQTTIPLRTVWKKEKSCNVKWCPDWTDTGIKLALSFFLSFSLYRLVYFSHFRPPLFRPLHPLLHLSLFCLFSCFSPLYLDYLLIITLLPCHHLSSSHQDFIFSFWLPTLFLLLFLLFSLFTSHSVR